MCSVCSLRETRKDVRACVCVIVRVFVYVCMQLCTYIFANVQKKFGYELNLERFCANLRKNDHGRIFRGI